MQVYFFNLTNPKRVFDGLEKPHLVEVGDNNDNDNDDDDDNYNDDTGRAVHLHAAVAEAEHHLA